MPDSVRTLLTIRQKTKAHASQRPKRFFCPDCKVSFSNEANFSGHYRMHQGETSCAMCGTSFFNEALLQHHMATKHQDLTTCPKCQMVFGSLPILEKHKKNCN